MAATKAVPCLLGSLGGVCAAAAALSYIILMGTAVFSLGYPSPSEALTPFLLACALNAPIVGAVLSVVALVWGRIRRVERSCTTRALSALALNAALLVVVLFTLGA